MISGDLLRVDNTRIPYIKSYKLMRAKLWKDADRNMSGSVRATLIGIFPKIKVIVGYTNLDENAAICTLLDKPFFDVRYYDNRTKNFHTAKYYAADYEVGIYNKHRGLYEPFEVTLVPIDKRNY